MNRIRSIIVILIILLTATPLQARQQAAASESGLLTLDTLFTYRPQALAEVEWQADGSGYLALEPSSSQKDALDLVRYDAATGAKTILVAAEKLVPPGASSPLVIEQYDFSRRSAREFYL